MFANKSFAGGWFIGDPGTKKYQDIFKRCPKGEIWPGLRKVIKAIDPYLSAFIYREHCVPQDIKFPLWNDLAHQQVWGGHLKAAHEKGLNLMILSNVHNFVLCSVLPSSRKDFDSCDDKKNMLRSLKAANEFFSKQDWAEIALSSSHARKIIHSGKLAIILSLEASTLFEEDWKKDFDEYYSLGVRTFQVVHQFNNKLAGAALHKNPIKLAQYIRNWLQYNKIEGFETKTDTYPTKFGEREVTKNIMGLTKMGKQVIQKMMDNGMPIDMAHVSEKTFDDIYYHIKTNGNYPIYMSHGHFRDTLQGSMGHFEKSSPISVLKKISAVDGLFGLRTFVVPTFHYFKELPNNCHGSTLSFAQAYLFGRKYDLNIAFGSDLNGFISQTKPRFSDTDKDYCKGQKFAKLNKDFDTTGLGRVDQLPVILDDLRAMKVDTTNIENSAEKYIQLWERADTYSSKIKK